MLAHFVTASYWALQWVASTMAWASEQESAHDAPGGTPNAPLSGSKFGQAIADAQIDSQLGVLPLEPPHAAPAATTHAICHALALI